ncbi:MAG TPA: class I SAM-dependent methyltransferase [Beijerinckiaceae bacterium]|nr:class I SAM-dependent methyltransferase [Beijerinckiaceae bacterium]
MTGSGQLKPFEDDEADGLVAYLTALYQGVFTPEAIRSHLANHVGFGFADYAVAVTKQALPAGARVLDLGCGFGSYVLAAREAGLDAIGIELAPFEIDFARSRSRRLRPQDDAERVYRVGDATRLAEEAGSFDGVTLWNVLEHIEDAGSLLTAVDALLKPGGQIFIVCPNYDAVRDEAHYHVPWTPELSRDRRAARDYLVSLGRDPAYFESSIHCRTWREVVGLLEGRGYDLFDLSSRRALSLRLGNLRSILADWKGWRALRNPARHSVELAALKSGRSRL